jgi:hypothetical protein
MRLVSPCKYVVLNGIIVNLYASNQAAAPSEKYWTHMHTTLSAPSPKKTGIGVYNS